jgi:hypothetical protein
MGQLGDKTLLLWQPSIFNRILSVNQFLIHRMDYGKKPDFIRTSVLRQMPIKVMILMMQEIRCSMLKSTAGLSDMQQGSPGI